MEKKKRELADQRDVNDVSPFLRQLKHLHQAKGQTTAGRTDNRLKRRKRAQERASLKQRYLTIHTPGPSLALQPHSTFYLPFAADCSNNPHLKSFHNF